MSSNEAFIYGSTIFKLAGTSWVRGRLIPNKDYLIAAKWYFCNLCNPKTNSNCQAFLSGCPSETSPCSECQSGCTTCPTMSCWDFSDATSVPGSKSYPNQYPWSTSTGWETGCLQ
jgi:hypothetical protein